MCDADLIGCDMRQKQHEETLFERIFSCLEQDVWNVMHDAIQPTREIRHWKLALQLCTCTLTNVTRENRCGSQAAKLKRYGSYLKKQALVERAGNSRHYWHQQRLEGELWRRLIFVCARLAWSGLATVRTGNPAMPACIKCTGGGDEVATRKEM